MADRPRILITGANGYIGRHLVRSLAKDDRSLRGFGRGNKPNNLPLDEWIQGDICDGTATQAAVQDCHSIIHLACMPMNEVALDPVQGFQVNATGTLQLLETAAHNGVSQFVYASTAQVYGHSEALPTKEEEKPKPVSAYGASKLAGEILCQTYGRSTNYDIGVTILRLFNVYGGYLDTAPRPTVESIFLSQAIQGIVPKVIAPEGEGRDFVYIEDVVSAFISASGLRGSGEIINIGSGVMISLVELAETVIDLADLNSSAQIDIREGKPLQLHAGIQKARQLLKFRPSVSLKDGLSTMYEELKKSEGIAN